MTWMTNQNLLATELAESIISLRHTFKQVAQLCWKCKSLSGSSIISQVVMEKLHWWGISSPQIVNCGSRTLVQAEKGIKGWIVKISS